MPNSTSTLPVISPDLYQWAKMYRDSLATPSYDFSRSIEENSVELAKITGSREVLDKLLALYLQQKKERGG